MASPSKQMMKDGVPTRSGRVKRRMSNFLKSADLESIDPLCLPDPPTPSTAVVVKRSKPISSLPAADFLRDVTNTPTTPASSPIPKQKRKRRQTILLPIMDLPKTNNDVPVDHTTIPIVTNVQPTNQESTNSTVTTTSSNGTNMLPSMLRKYCSLPLEERLTSNCVQQIYDLSGGYKLLSDYSILQQANNTTHTRDSEEVLLQKNRRQILTNMIPAMELLEQQRHTETQYIQSMTQCRSEKIRRKGGTNEYIYFDISTQQQVNPLEYTQRYLQAVQFAKQQKPQFYNEDNSHSSKEQSHNSSSSLKEQELGSITLSTIDSNKQKEHTNILELTCSPSDSPHNNICMPLSLPARDDISSNPDVALAQQRLWKAIDDALHEYSTEVMRIRNQSNNNNTK